MAVATLVLITGCADEKQGRIMALEREVIELRQEIKRLNDGLDDCQLTKQSWHQAYIRLLGEIE